jgi:uncharacterized protein YndB with AHSA1/START domain
MMSATQIDAPDGVPFIDMSREFDAPRDLVFRAYTDPDLLAQWLGPRNYKMVVESWDVRDGGKWRYVHTDADGNAYAFHGVFHGDQSPDGMLQTFEFEGWPGQVSLESLVFEERDGKTVLRNHSVYQSVEARDAMIESGMERGVNEGYAKLDELLAKLRQPVA